MLKKHNKWKMKFKITNTFIIFFIIVFVVLIIGNMSMLYVVEEKEKNFDLTMSPEEFTLNFKENINLKNSSIDISKKGQISLKDNSAWIQIVDENLKEVYSVYKPTKVPLKYSTFDLIHANKYDIEGDTVFISKINYENHTYLYLIGFPINNVAKHTLVYKPYFYINVLKHIGIIFAIDIIVIVLLVYFILGEKFSKPINRMIEGIKELSLGNYNKMYESKGIYKQVFEDLNNLSKVLNKSRDDKKELENMRDQWIYSISHDLKTPLASIKGFAEIMKDLDYNFTAEEIREYSAVIWNKSLYIQCLIEELNLTNKLKNKLIPLKFVKTDVKIFIEEIILEILNDPVLKNRNIIFKCEHELYVDIDYNLMKRAIVNLIMNSLKHNTEDVIVKIDAYKTDSINIVIEDNGKGIETQDLKNIFNRYYRGSNTSSIEGSGLGMAIAKQVINAHGGEIFIESKGGQGTKIVIHINN
jgi:signal transduction histidine kinase/methionine-rich copper-binding protein CopC